MTKKSDKMPTVIYIKAVKDTNLLLLGISEGEETKRYTVSEPLYASIGSPRRNDTVSYEALAEVYRFDEYYRAKRKALSLLSYSDKNERELARKLSLSGFSREVSREVSREMVSLGYVDESRQLERIILAEANVKLYGYAKIRTRLLARGYSAADVKRVTGELVGRGEISFNKNAHLLVEKRLPEGATLEEKKKLLYKNGYKV